jgi:hypothetical protein
MQASWLEAIHEPASLLPVTQALALAPSTTLGQLPSPAKPRAIAKPRQIIQACHALGTDRITSRSGKGSSATPAIMAMALLWTVSQYSDRQDVT